MDSSIPVLTCNTSRYNAGLPPNLQKKISCLSSITHSRELYRLVSDAINAVASREKIQNFPFPAGMVKNGQILVRLNGGHWDMSSHMIVVEMKSGDIVSVRSHERGIDFSGDDYSTFSGFLLYDYSDEKPVVGK